MIICYDCGGFQRGEYVPPDSYACECVRCERCDAPTENEAIDDTVLCAACEAVMAVPFPLRAAFDLMEPVATNRGAL